MSDFDEYVAARGPALLALAVLVTGDEAEARSHVATSLARAMPRWESLVHHEDPDAHLRRDLIASATRRRRRSGPSRASAWEATPEQLRVWHEWLRLSRPTRALVVLRHREHRSWAELAWLTELPERTLRQRTEEALARVGGRDAALDTLEARVAAVDTWPVELSSQAERTSRTRRARQVRWGVAAGAVALVGLPILVAVLPEGLREFDVSPVPEDGQVPESLLPAGWRAESWRGVEVGVPGEWGYGSMPHWCATDDTATPRVDRPGPTPTVACAPSLAPGVQFRVAGDPAPEVPDTLVAGEIEVDGVVVLAATTDAALTEQVLDTVRAVERLDASGCEVQRAIPRAGKSFLPSEPGRTSLSLCRYAVGVSGPNLVQSERLSVLDSVETLQALEEAPTVVAPQGCLDGPDEEVVLVASDQGDVAWVHLGRCQGMDDDATHLLTEDLLYWVLSPGWVSSGEDLPLPDDLRPGVSSLTGDPAGDGQSSG